jgi:hypothetical protein
VVAGGGGAKGGRRLRHGGPAAKERPCDEADCRPPALRVAHAWPCYRAALVPSTTTGNDLQLLTAFGLASLLLDCFRLT